MIINYSPHAYDEMDIIGHDGHMYRGRLQRKLPNLQNSKVLSITLCCYYVSLVATKE